MGFRAASRRVRSVRNTRLIPSRRRVEAEPGKLQRLGNWWRPKPKSFSWFSSKENHSSRILTDQSNCETALEKPGASCIHSGEPGKSEAWDETVFVSMSPPFDRRRS